jgi:predicted Fe-Mo cluster-binding NifX family protein
MILLDSVRVLLDASLDYKSLDRIREIVLADPRVAAINNIWARNAGRYKFVELDLVLRVRELEKGHRLSEEIENRVKLEIAQVDRVLIHFQPREQRTLTIGIPLAEDRLSISEHFGEAPFFRLLTLQRADGAVIEDQVFDNPCLQEPKAKGIKVAQWLLAKGIDLLIAIHDQSGKGPGFVLGNAGVEILLTKETLAEKALAVIQRKHRETETEI